MFVKCLDKPGTTESILHSLSALILKKSLGTIIILVGAQLTWEH